jgi:hypothetical protein
LFHDNGRGEKESKEKAVKCGCQPKCEDVIVNKVGRKYWTAKIIANGMRIILRRDLETWTNIWQARA